jgi:hypothetical protein
MFIIYNNIYILYNKYNKNNIYIYTEYVLYGLLTTYDSGDASPLFFDRAPGFLPWNHAGFML